MQDEEGFIANYFHVVVIFPYYAWTWKANFFTKLYPKHFYAVNFYLLANVAYVTILRT